MAAPVLRLVVEKGPKKGETLDRKPGTLIRIGRVVKGNTFAIKDPAISQHHLVIRFLPEASRWTLEDLGTSNGTLVNDAKIPPSDPFPLSDGDIVKIGESTSISVGIEAVAEAEVEERRNARNRRGRSKKVEEVVVDSDAEEKSEVPKRNATERRGRSKKVEDPVGVVVKDDVLEQVVEESIEEVKNLRTGRPRRGKDAVAEVPIQESRNLRRGRPRRGDSSKVPEGNEASGLVVEDSMDSPKDAGRTRARRAPARTRASSAKVMAEEEKPSSNSEAEEVAGEEELDGGCHGGDKSKIMGSGKETENVGRVEEETIVDIQKMTLGEWFDSMEKFLPMAINDVAEEIILSLREKARRFVEFIEKASDAC